MNLTFPAVQLALDYATIDEALAMAEIGVRAGVDILEAGTPLIVAEGARAIGRLAQTFPEYTVLADYKTMDSGGKNVLVTQAQGGHIMTVCANAADETVQAAVTEGKRTGIIVVTDTIGVKDQPARAKQCADWGVDLIYLHRATDEWRRDATLTATPWVTPVIAAVGDTPVGCGVFGVDDAVANVKLGADLVAIGHPLLGMDNVEDELRRFVEQVKASYRPRA